MKKPSSNKPTNNNKGPISRKSKSQGRRGSYNKGLSRDEVESKDFTSKGSNDISWYAQDLTLLKNSANFPWSTQNGLTYDDEHIIANTNGVITVPKTFTSPGIMALHVLPGIGKTAYELDAVNIAANAMYVFIRHMNSGAKNYDAPDLMNYVMAMDEVFTAINFAQRLYGTLGMYTVYNRYLPEALIKVQGIDADDLRENMVQFRYRLNTIIKQAATLVVPNTFPIFQRHAFLFKDYYIEGDDMKDQIYLYTPMNFRKFEIPAGGGPGHLIYEPLKGLSNIYRFDHLTPITGNELLDVIQDMVSRIYLDEDFGIMAGDILKAYGESGVMRLSELPDSYVCTLNANNEVLLQMKNANICSGAWRAFASDRATHTPFSAIFGNIEQDPNTNKISEELNVPFADLPAYELCDANHHLLTLEGEPSPEMNMIMTRMTHDYNISVANQSIEYLCGTELVTHGSIVIDVDPWTVMGLGNGITEDETSSSSIDVSNLMVDTISKFKYHPNFFMVQVSNNPPATASDVVNIRRVFQVDNFTFISRDMLDRLNQVAIMSEFNVPHMALMT